MNPQYYHGVSLISIKISNADIKPNKGNIRWQIL